MESDIEEDRKKIESIWVILDDLERECFYKWIKNENESLCNVIKVHITVEDEIKLELISWHFDQYYQLMSFVNKKGDKLFSPFVVKRFQESKFFIEMREKLLKKNMSNE